MGIFDKDDLPGLVERCRRGDSRAWGMLVDRFANFVYSVARRYRLNEDDSADVFQLTFQALHVSIGKIENPETLPKWLAVTASRTSLRILRNQGKTVPLVSEDADLTEVLAAEDETAEQSALLACDSLILREAVTKLGGKCTPLLESLYLREESSYQEISDRLGIPMGAIGPTRARCLDKLRKALTEDDFFS